MTPQRPEAKSQTEPLDLQHKADDMLAGRRPLEKIYPYIAPDYHIPFVHIGTEKQLVLDNFILDHFDGVERVIPTPHRPERGVLEVGELPWENPTYANPGPCGAIYDPQDNKFKLWYIQSLTGDPFNTGQVLCYAESTDCLHWEKPLSPLCLPYKDHKETNIVFYDASSCEVVLNPDQSDPSRRFLMLNCPYGLAVSRGHRIFSQAAASPDGLQWHILHEDAPFRHQHHMRPWWDEAIQKWIAYGQYSHHWNFLYRTRQIGREESADFVNWSPKEVVISADWDPTLPPHLEFHEMSVRKVGSQYIGITGEAMTDPLWCVNNDTLANWRDHFHVRLGLYSSRDGRRWQRAGGPGPWVDNRGPGSIDYGYACASTNGYLVHHGKMHVYYMAGPQKQHWFKGTPPRPVVPETDFERAREEWVTTRDTATGYGGLRRSTGVLILREDGWAELRPTYERGTVYTKQFVFEGDTLRLNADVYGGYIRVAALDPYFKPYDGFSADDCDPVTTPRPDQIWHTVTWRGNQSVAALWNKPVRLAIQLNQASLFAFHFVA